MKEITHFFKELLANAEDYRLFNSGINEAEVMANRKTLLNKAGVKQAHGLLEMPSKDLQHFIEKQLFKKTGEELENTISGCIAKQMLQHPGRIAIIDGHTEITYSQLLHRAGEISGEISARNIQQGSLIGVCMNRTWELVATLLGIMQAGCAYVPLDPAYPQNRIQYMLQHSRAVAAIVDTNLNADLCKEAGALIHIDKISRNSDYAIQTTPRQLAYVIYTSGSTGKPKGVAIEHKGLIDMRRSNRELFSDEELSGVFAAASVSFDTSVMEILGTLSLGGTIILAKNALELTTLPATSKIKMVVMVASAMQAILTTEKLPENIQCLIFGGEALKRSLVDQIYALETAPRILNAYGPTEDTVYSTIANIPRGTKVITIGKSVPNSQAYILNNDLQPVAIGEAGELYLAGTKLARGYLYDEKQTKARFIEIVPNDKIKHTRLYKTGDLCRFTKNGEIEFLGRVDQQVKIRGYRIELEEIESTLETMPGIDAAAATAIEGSTGQKILAVFVVASNKSGTADEVKAFLAERLPGYMVPQVVKYLKTLPFLPNDKLDRKKLATMEVEEIHNPSGFNKTKEIHHHQENTILGTIQRELSAILNLGDPTQIPSNKSFDSLGLDSLSILEFSSRLTKITGKKLSAPVLISNPTPEALVNYITNHHNSDSDSNGHSQSNLINTKTNSLADFQMHIQSSHPTFQAAKAATWNATDKSKLVQEVLKMVNNNRRNPYSKVLQTGSATKGIVGDAYNDEKQEAIIWTTNLYLGLNRDKQVMQEAAISLEKFGTGMGTSAAASGMTGQHLEFETEFAALTGKPAACLFPTGYTANVGAVAGLLGKNDVVVIDQLCHASIVDGARLCGATIRTFKHNSAPDLEEVLKSEVSPYRTILVVLEGVYSMGEGAAPVAEIVRMAKKYNALVLVDEAHSFGFYGERGAGICAAQGITEEVDFIMTTLSKALGSLGGVVSASQEHIDLLKSSSRAYIFQASVSPADMAAALTALRRIRTDDTLRERLWDTTHYMRTQFKKAGYDLGTGDGPIVTPHFSDKDKLYAIVQSMYRRGIQTSAVTYPIVEIGKGRLRFICSAAHTREDVDKTLAALIEAEKEVELQLGKTASHYHRNLPDISKPEIVKWAGSFITYLNKTITNRGNATPDLTIKLQASEQDVLCIIQCKNGKVSLATSQPTDLPFCELTLKENTAISAILTSDIQLLLNCISKGTCVLNGQIEPFIWFVGRIIDQLKTTVGGKNSKQHTLETIVE